MVHSRSQRQLSLHLPKRLQPGARSWQCRRQSLGQSLGPMKMGILRLAAPHAQQTCNRLADALRHRNVVFFFPFFLLRRFDRLLKLLVLLLQLVKCSPTRVGFALLLGVVAPCALVSFLFFFISITNSMTPSSTTSFAPAPWHRSQCSGTLLQAMAKCSSWQPASRARAAPATGRPGHGTPPSGALRG